MPRVYKEFTNDHGEHCSVEIVHDEDGITIISEQAHLRWRNVYSDDFADVIYQLLTELRPGFKAR